MNKNVIGAFINLKSALLVAMASDFTEEKEAEIYARLYTIISTLEETFITIIKLIRRNTNE